jgi:hypothetical protein
MVSTSFTGIDRDLVKRCRAAARDRKLKLWQWYAEAVAGLVELQRRGVQIHWPATKRQGDKPHSVRLPYDTVETIRQLAAQHGISRTTVFLTAIRLHLEPGNVLVH